LSKVYNKVTILQNDQPIHVFKDLAVGYQDSISQLEKKIVGLSLNIWRNNHKKIISS
jgi:hypothetical protein